MLTTRQIILIGIIIILIAVSVVFIYLGVKVRKTYATLTMHGVDAEIVWEPIIATFEIQNPGVKILYKKIDANEYENTLLSSLAGTNPPDIAYFNNAWLPKHIGKIMPLVDSATLRQFYPLVVSQDFVSGGKAYALPLFIDTIGLIYNKDLFDAKGLIYAPKTWEELINNYISKFRMVDRTGRLTKTAIAIGGSTKSIDIATDLLSLLMLQNGTKMVADDFSKTTFLSKSGQNALEFYTDFANYRKNVFTWSEDFGNYLDTFAIGKTAMIFGYSSRVAEILAKNPLLRLGIAPMLQNTEEYPVNYANYWGLAITQRTRFFDIAKKFIAFATIDSKVSQVYLEAVKKPPALLSLIDSYAKNSQDLGIFAKQALTAKSWPQIDNNLIKLVFSEMIANVLSGRISIEAALEDAVGKINERMKTAIISYELKSEPKRSGLFGLINVANAEDGEVEGNGKYKGLVKCDPTKTDPADPDFCSISAAQTTLEAIIGFLTIYIAIPLATLAFAIGGFILIFAGGNPQKIQQGRSIMVATAIGLAIVIGAYAIVHLLAYLLKEFLGASSIRSQ